MLWDSAFLENAQLKHLCMILFDYFNVSRMAGGTVRSKEQLNRKLIDIIRQAEDKDLIFSDFTYWNKVDSEHSVDDSVNNIFKFKKNVVNYNLPKIIYAISDIQKEIFNR